MHDVPPWSVITSPWYRACISFSVNQDRPGLPHATGRGSVEIGIQLVALDFTCWSIALFTSTTTMASTFTGATSSTGPSTGSNRKHVFPPGGDPPPSPKKQKRPTKLDQLKAALQGEVGNLREAYERSGIPLGRKACKEGCQICVHRPIRVMRHHS